MAITTASVSVLSVGGTSTAVSAGAATNTAGNAYQINTASRRVMDPATAVVAYDGGVPATVSSIDYLFGIVTLAAPPGGAVTVDYNYIPLLPMVSIKSYEISPSRTALDSTVMSSTTTYKSVMLGLKDASGSISGLDPLDTDLDSGGGTVTLQGIFAAGVTKFLDIAISSAISFRAWVVFPDIKTNGEVDGLVEGTVNWTSAPLAGTTYAAGGSFGFGAP
jgi:hypothetical protein